MRIVRHGLYLFAKEQHHLAKDNHALLNLRAPSYREVRPFRLYLANREHHKQPEMS